MKEHNTNFYSLENIKETLESCKDFLDGEEVYYHIGALRYAYEEIERLNKIINIKSDFIIDLLEKIYFSDDTILHTEAHLIGEEYEDKLKELKGDDKE